MFAPDDERAFSSLSATLPLGRPGEVRTRHGLACCTDRIGFSVEVPELRVRRDDLDSSELVAGESLREELDVGEAQLLVERFALSANNVTYATLGEQLGYWRLFPAPESWGRIPAWGYARVVGSRSPALAEGQRTFGLVPMGSHLTVCPGPHPAGFIDAAPHRAELSPVYNQYLSLGDEGDDAALRGRSRRAGLGAERTYGAGAASCRGRGM